MLGNYFQFAAFAMAMAQFAEAQDSVPQDLQAGFESSGKEVQVSYTNNAVSGFSDGTSFEKDEVADEPTFALGDSSGISSTTLYTIIMVDTTCDDARKLHYARSNFKYNFDITNLETDSEPLLEYKAPGAFGEAGDDRKYTFLMYTNPGRKEITELQMPGEGETFDVKKFQDDNGLRDAGAGLGMTVKLGGESSCDGSGSAPSPGGTESSSAAAEEPASATSAPAGGAAPSPTPSPAASSAPASGGPAPGGAEPTPSSPQASSAASPTPTGGSDDEPASSPEPSQAPGDSQDDTIPSPSGPTTGLAAATSIPPSNGTAPTSGGFNTSVVQDPAEATGGSETTAALPAEQTASAGSEIPSALAQCLIVASIITFAGFGL